MQSSFTVLFPVFSGYDCTVIFTDDVRAVARQYKEKVSKNTAACFITKKATPLSSWLVFGLNPSADEIAHECWHCIYRLLKTVGAELEDEVVAYHLGYLVGKIHEFKEQRKW